MKSILTFIIILFAVTNAHASEPLRILYIGNSLTFMHNIPQLFADIAASKGETVEFHAHTPGGATFEDHDQNQILTDLLQEQSWDVVLLQEQSQRTAFPEEQKERVVYEPAANLVSKARSANPEAEIIFYMTFARRNGDPMNVRVMPQVKTYLGMQDLVIASYEEMVEENDAGLAPVGKVWKDMRREHPNIALYDDAVHQNSLGAYLAACTIFVTIFGQSCAGTPVAGQYDQESVAIVHRMIDAHL